MSLYVTNISRLSKRPSLYITPSLRSSLMSFTTNTLRLFHHNCSLIDGISWQCNMLLAALVFSLFGSNYTGAGSEPGPTQITTFYYAHQIKTAGPVKTIHYLFFFIYQLFFVLMFINSSKSQKIQYVFKLGKRGIWMFRHMFLLPAASQNV